MDDNIIPFPKNPYEDIDVLYSVGEQEMYFIIVLEKLNTSVKIYLNKPEEDVDRVDPDDNVEIGNFKFETLQEAQEFYKSIKYMSAIALLMLLNEKQIKII